MSKVYIVIEAFNYEGYSEPNAVFDSYEKAKERRSELEKENDFLGYNVEIFEMEIL
jgi:hypothetical protein